MMMWSPATPLSQVKSWLRAHVDEGAVCPCCGQMAKVYKRKLNSGMARSLIAMFVVGGTDWIHVPTQIGARHREEGKLRYWGLVEEATTPRPDGGRAGWWRLTPRGVEFVTGKALVHRYARVYNGKCIGVGGDPISIRDALGSQFNYDELMGTP